MNKKDIIIRETIIKNLQKIIDNHNFSIECNPEDSAIHKKEIENLQEQIEYIRKN